MIRFGRITNLQTESDLAKMAQVQAIFRRVFHVVAGYADKIPRLFYDHSSLGFDPVLLTAEDGRGRVIAFALAYYYPTHQYAYLDYIASDPERRARGLGDALYETLRDYVSKVGARGLFMDVPPDGPAEASSPALLAENQKRLHFYERFGARPIIGSLWEAESTVPGGLDNPYLVFDPLGGNEPLSRSTARKVVKTILVKKYGWEPEAENTKRIVKSFADDPIRIRPPRYVKSSRRSTPEKLHILKYLVADHHEIHHVRERGYVERPARVDAILAGFVDLPFERRPVRHYDEKPIRAVHDGDFVSYLHAACKGLGEKETLYPYVFPIRRPERKPRDRALRAGYYCIDTFTPLSRSALAAARAAVDTAMSAAEFVLRGERLVYALCRPPGHHAERRVFGGFCYFSNAAIAAHHLSSKGRVAMLDIDYHHGNGAQDIFWRRGDVLTLSLHGHPNHAYPYFSGFADERGEGDGKGRNRNFPLAEGLGDEQYLEVLHQALKEIRGFKPDFLVVPTGFDTMKGDPTGALQLTPPGVRRIGEEIRKLDIPTLLVQEGGYTLRNLRQGARALFLGLTASP